MVKPLDASKVASSWGGRWTLDVGSMAMLSALAKDLTGASDICAIVEGLDDLRALAAAPYVLPGETLLFAFASPKEEFAFTDEALIRAQGASAANPRKLVERFEYRDCAFSGVRFVTTGRLDRDCELQFSVGEEQVAVEIRRKDEARAKTFYRALVALSRAQEERQRAWTLAESTLESTMTSYTKPSSLGSSGQQSNALTVTERATSVMERLQREFDRVHSRSYKQILTKEITRAA